jgi:hypothetical protein
MALFLGAHIYDLHCLGSLSTTTLAPWIVVLFLFNCGWPGVHWDTRFPGLFRRHHTRDTANRLVAATARDARGEEMDSE